MSLKQSSTCNMLYNYNRGELHDACSKDDPTYLVQLPGSRLAGTVLVVVGVGGVDVGAAELVGVGVVLAIQRICPT